MIIKTKFYCKGGMKRGSSPVAANNFWTEIFIEGKWYDGEYETWDWEDGYRINGGWRKYWVVNELGEKEEVSKSRMRVVFNTEINEIRDQKIDDILNG